MRLAIVGGGWAGLSAAVRAVEAGHQVSVYEMAGQWGGRAREVQVEGLALDNGQHILIGAYTRTLALMSTIGIEPSRVLHRQPLELRYPDGRGLRMPGGPAWLGFAAATWNCVGFSWRDKAVLLRAAAGWALRRFECPAGWTVEHLCHSLPPAVRQLLIDPLCVAALNTPARQASAAVFLRVLRDALFSGRGSADLLLPRQSLGHLLPTPAAAWLQARGAQMLLGQRVAGLARSSAGWRIDGTSFDAVVLACSASEAARLAQPHAAAWSQLATQMAYEPIITVYVHCAGGRLPCAMTALAEGPQAPAQFAFDHGALGASPGVFAFVVSGARPWVERGLEETGLAVLRQAVEVMPAGTWPHAPKLLRTMAEKRATFACTPGLKRPAQQVGPGLVAAGDYVAGPYPATLEGAVRSAEAAVGRLQS
jgi:squalene-associated FAD-dependent desaturase